MSNNATLWIVVALAAAAAVMLAVAAVTASRRRAHARSFELRQRFGPEYDRAVEALGSPARAERELAARTRRVERIHLQDLSRADRSRFGASWGTVQAQFVDDPAGAAVNANELIKEVMRARGYPADDFDHRVADLSVDHADVVQHYRAARALTESSRNGQVNTEELRQALVHYRALFSDLLQETAAPPSLRREAHA